MIDVLVIDDEEALRDLLLRVLVREGYSADGAANGDEGLKKFGEAPARLVIIDMMMPKMDGTKTIGLLRRAGQSVSVLAISGNPSLSLDMAKTLGADAVLIKPFRPATLIDTVRDLLGPAGH